jgi:tetratricopeptide (TPR) repeat protein
MHVGMARSFQRLQPGETIGAVDGSHFYHPPSDRHYELRRDEQRFVLRRYRLDAAGRQIHLRDQVVDYVIGSGNNSQGLLYRTPEGALFQMPVAWMVDAERWAMAPGYDHADHDDFDRAVSRACMFCHNAYPTATLEQDAYGQREVFEEQLPEGIGCQRCHGPGANHIRVANRVGAALHEIRATITNPARLDAALGDDVCLQCHLQPSSKRTTILRRFGTGDYDFRPGERLSDYLVHLDVIGPETASRFEINHHPYRLHQSRCYTASGGALRCVTCHDPHHRVAPADSSAHYRAACLTCHDREACHRPEHNQETVAADCAGCHMGKRYTDDVVHVAMTDHRIQRQPAPLGEAPLETGSPRGGRVQPYSVQRNHTIEEIYSALAETMDGETGSIERLSAALDTQAATAFEPRVELGLALMASGQIAQARRQWIDVLASHPDVALIHHNLGVVNLALGDMQSAMTQLGNAVRLDPDRPESHYNLGVAATRRGQSQAAADHYRRALQLRPMYHKSLFNLGNLAARDGDFERAVRHYRLSLAADPDAPAAQGNLGRALERLGQWREALAVWQEAAQMRPPVDHAAGNAAMILLSAPDAALRDPRQGAEWAHLAIAAAPADASGYALAAVAAAQQSDAERAMQGLRKAASLGMDPLDQQLLEAWLSGQTPGALPPAPHRTALRRTLIRLNSQGPKSQPNSG